jgi:hypothetical protein
VSSRKKPKTPKQPAKTLAEEVAEALESVSRPRPALDELADRETGSPGPIPDSGKP